MRQREPFSAHQELVASSLHLVRTVLHAPVQTDTCGTCGKGITRQLFAILPKIREVDALMAPNIQNRLREAHPEVTFGVLSGRGRGLDTRKNQSQGHSERLKILAKHFSAVPDLKVVRDQLGRGRVALDDLADALVCLATAQRWSTGNVVLFPRDGDCHDTRGLRMEMVA